MNDAGVIIGSYAVTIVGIGAYVAWMLRRARRLAAHIRDEDRPWT
ncbi:MAG: CcmD family protein [Acidimicrobiia bacterium]